MRSTVLPFLLLIPLAAAAAQTAQIRVSSPEGYRRVDRGARVILRHSYPSGEEHVIRVSLASSSSGASNASAFLDALRAPDEELAADSEQAVDLAGRSGRQLTLVGRSKLAGRSRPQRKTLMAAELESGHFLLIRSLLVHDAPGPDADVVDQVDAALEKALASLALIEAGPNPATDLKEGGAEEEKRLLYESDAVIPFSFAVPGSWTIVQDQHSLPGYLFCLAAPAAGFLRGVEVKGRGLRVRALAHSESLLAAADPLPRAVEIAMAELRAESPEAQIEAEARSLMGGASGVLIAFDLGSERRRGLQLVVTAGTSVLVAEYFSRDADEAWREEGLRVLNTFSFDVELGSEVFVLDEGGLHLRVPNGWDLDEARTSDRSSAWVLRAPDGTELVLRSRSWPEARGLSREELLKLAEIFLFEEMELLEEDELAEHVPVVWCGAEEALRFVRVAEDETLDCYLFLRGGALHLGLIRLPGGATGRSWGRALRVLFGVAGREPVPEFFEAGPIFFAGRPMANVTYVRAGFGIYDAAGHFNGGDSERLQLRPDGRALLFESRAGSSRLRSGRFRLEIDALRIEFEDGEEPRRLDLISDECGLRFRGPERGKGRPWFFVPGA